MKNKSFTYLALTIILSGIWISFVLLPLHKEKLTLIVKKHELESQLTDYKRTLENLPNIIKEQNNFLLFKNSLNDKLYTKRDLLKLFEKLNTLAASSDLVIDEITPPIEELLTLNRMVSDSTQPLFLNISLKMTGQYDRFGRFVKMVESSNFFRSTNLCQVIGSNEFDEELLFRFGFKALLGNLSNKS